MQMQCMLNCQKVAEMLRLIRMNRYTHTISENEHFFCNRSVIICSVLLNSYQVKYIIKEGMTVLESAATPSTGRPLRAFK